MVKTITAIAMPVLLLAALITLLGKTPAVQAGPLQSEGSSTYVVLQTAAITNGNGTTVAPVGVPDTYAELTVQATGMVSGTINWEATVDGTNWVGLPATPVTSGSAAVTATAAGIYRMDVTGLRSVRARVSGIITTTTDTINIAGYLTAP